MFSAFSIGVLMLYEFSLSSSQIEKLNKFSFTPTSLGMITKVKYFGKTIDLTDYDDW